jgi:hypothetical protein
MTLRTPADLNVPTSVVFFICSHYLLRKVCACSERSTNLSLVQQMQAKAFLSLAMSRHVKHLLFSLFRLAFSESISPIFMSPMFLAFLKSIRIFASLRLLLSARPVQVATLR